MTKPTVKPILYSDLGGRVACPDHMGSAARSVMKGRTPPVVRTSITLWERYTKDDIEYWVEEFGAPPSCEECHRLSTIKPLV